MSDKQTEIRTLSNDFFKYLSLKNFGKSKQRVAKWALYLIEKWSQNQNIDLPNDITYLIGIFTINTIDSNIANSKQTWIFDKWLKPTNTYKLLYRASEHNFDCDIFHKLCDNQGNLLCVFSIFFSLFLCYFLFFVFHFVVLYNLFTNCEFAQKQK